MSKVAHYLQEHVIGEVVTSTDARRYFAHDASVLQLAPTLIVYPRNENDVRKTARFSWQLAERGRVIPITARGSGTDQAGAALSSGIMVVFPAHMNRILELDTKAHTVTVEPGLNFAKLQQTLHTHGRFLPSYPASIEYSTIGGAIGNNSSGEKSIKYGDTRDFVQSLRVVLANGEVIETGRLNKRELKNKLGLATFEGEIYRSVDTLLEEQAALVKQLQPHLPRDKTGYCLWDVKHKDGSFDLTPLFVGSQGTLGIVTEAVIATETHNPQTTVMLASFNSLEHLQNAVADLVDMPDPASAIEIVDGHLLRQVNEANPNLLKDILPEAQPLAVLLVEFDDSDRTVKKAVKRAEKIFADAGADVQVSSEPEQQQLFWKVRQASSALIAHNEGAHRAVPLFGEGAVPVRRMREYIDGIYKLLEKSGVEPAIWGRAGNGLLRVQPRFNLAQVGDRQKAFKLMDEYHKLVLALGGTISAEGNDGRLRTPYLEAQYGAELYALLKKVKTIFDPYGMMNPGVKFDTTIEDIKAMTGNDYGLEHLYDHLPRS